MVRRSQAHQERLLDPDKARLALKAIEFPPPPPPTAEEKAKAEREYEEFLAAILSEEYPVAA